MYFSTVLYFNLIFFNFFLRPRRWRRRRRDITEPTRGIFHARPETVPNAHTKRIRLRAQKKIKRILNTRAAAKKIKYNK